MNGLLRRYAPRNDVGEIRHRERSAAIHAAGRLENCMKIIDKKKKM